MSFADDGGTGRVMQDEDDDEINDTRQIRDETLLGQIEEESHNQEDDEDLMQQKMA